MAFQVFERSEESGLARPPFSAGPFYFFGPCYAGFKSKRPLSGARAWRGPEPELSCDSDSLRVPGGRARTTAILVAGGSSLAWGWGLGACSWAGGWGLGGLGTGGWALELGLAAGSWWLGAGGLGAGLRRLGAAGWGCPGMGTGAGMGTARGLGMIDMGMGGMAWTWASGWR